MKDFIKKYFVLIILLLLSLVIIGFGIYLYFHNLYKIDKDFSKIDLTNIDNLMIVAHPDDETLWGGAHLIKDNYLVVVPSSETSSEYFVYNRTTKEAEKIDNLLKYLIVQGSPDFLFSFPQEDERQMIVERIGELKDASKQKVYMPKENK